MKVLVLGGFGFIGSHITKKLSKEGYEAIPASRKNGVDLFDYKNFKNYLCDLKPDSIINCAANVGSVNYVSEFSADVIFSNVQILINLYKAISESCPKTKIINPLSNCSYPGESDIQKEVDWLSGDVHDSVFSYGNSKRILYLVAKCYKQQYNINSKNILVPNTFGPGDSLDPNKTHALNGMIVRMIKSMRKKEETFEIWGTGTPVREWAYVEDVVNILIECIKYDKELLYPVNLAQNKAFTISESAHLIKEILKYNGTLFFNTYYQDGAPVKVLDDTQFKELFPKFEFYNHKLGLEQTINYYKNALNKESI